MDALMGMESQGEIASILSWITARKNGSPYELPHA
jgi:hypothetical protein